MPISVPNIAIDAPHAPKNANITFPLFLPVCFTGYALYCSCHALVTRFCFVELIILKPVYQQRN